ncbi:MULTISPECIES: alpha/beta fold hydrolase [unclassified Streptomyces]|uniref:dienelactone hydrolase family protein n=1 Tax=unclassified Streptomyces TaxID=2593676 RepID=UPI00037E4C21|nr:MULTISPECIES: alpha/beta fold hydrolase [unclassified Streptomyces]MYX32164.1 alpha/beta hydrolase [Streptomyces sp. SID8377]
MTYGDEAGGGRPRPALVPYVLPQRPHAAVLVLHGGRAEGLEPPPALNLPGARMRPFVRAIGRATAGHGVALAGVRYRHRGWNGEREDAARDALRALEALRQRAGEVPVVLVGHSMGGRAALRAAGHPLVGAVVGLAPWCPEGEPVGHLAGRRLVLLHGDRDRVTDPAGSLTLADRARAAGAEACHLVVPGGDHAMLRGAGAWHDLTARLVAGLLRLGPLPPEVAGALTAPGSEGAR